MLQIECERDLATTIDASIEAKTDFLRLAPAAETPTDQIICARDDSKRSESAAMLRGEQSTSIVIATGLVASSRDSPSCE
jgi:hypothetical protein